MILLITQLLSSYLNKGSESLRNEERKNSSGFVGLWLTDYKKTSSPPIRFHLFLGFTLCAKNTAQILFRVFNRSSQLRGKTPFHRYGLRSAYYLLQGPVESSGYFCCWKISRNKLKKHSVTRNCSDLSLFE